MILPYVQSKVVHSRWRLTHSEKTRPKAHLIRHGFLLTHSFLSFLLFFQVTGHGPADLRPQILQTFQPSLNGREAPKQQDQPAWYPCCILCSLEQLGGPQQNKDTHLQGSGVAWGAIWTKHSFLLPLTEFTEVILDQECGIELSNSDLLLCQGKTLSALLLGICGLFFGTSVFPKSSME